jgi:hypothetical protein
MKPVMAQDLLDSIEAVCCKCKGRLEPILEEAKLFHSKTDTESDPDVSWTAFAQCTKCNRRWVFTFGPSGCARYNLYDMPTDPKWSGVAMPVASGHAELAKP